MSHFKKIYFLLKAILNQLKQWFLELPRYKQVVAVLGSIAIIIIASRILPTKTKTAEVSDLPKQVELAFVSDLSNDNNPVPLVGSVTSVNQATIRALASGQLTRVYKKLGDKVYAGQLIAEFSNAGEKAAVLQAQGGYESAKAARDIALINSANTNVSGNDAQTNALNTINSTYSTMDDLVRTKTDIAFVDGKIQNPQFKVLVPDSILVSKIQNQRTSLEILLTARANANLSLNTSSDLLGELTKIQAEAQTIKTYFDDLSSAYAKSLPDQSFSANDLSNQKINVSVARSTIVGTLSGLTSAKIALQNSIAAKQIAGRTTGDANLGSASADAAVKTALGGYDAALARLENTIIRSPITGTLNSFSLQTGDYVNQSTQVAVVSNNGALEIVAYVTSDDATRIQVGSKVKINSTIDGIVTRLAGAIDPVTNKIEVRIGILNEKSDLINGESVKIEIGGMQSATIKKTKTTGEIKIPLSAVKITPRGSYVFILSATSSLQAVTVETGTLLGDEVEIKSGLTPDMQIIKDARGLKEDEVVSVK